MNQELKKIFSPLRIDMMISNGYLFQPIEVFSESLRSIAADKGRLFLPFLIFVVIGDLLAQVGVWAQFMVNLVLDPVLLIYVFSKFFSKTLGKTFHFASLLKEKWLKLIGFNLVYYIIMVLVLSPLLFALWNYRVLDKIIGGDTDITEALTAIPEQIHWVFILNFIVLVYMVISYWWSTILLVFFDYSIKDSFLNGHLLVNKSLSRHINLAMFVVLLFFLIQILVVQFASLGDNALRIVSLLGLSFLNLYFYTIIYTAFKLSYFQNIRIKIKRAAPSEDSDKKLD